MGNLFKIAIRNLMRYKRRTLLTASLITIGVVFVLVFIAVSGSFKNMMIGQITDSMLGHIQIHRKGYVASIDNLPLNLNLKTSSRGPDRAGPSKDARDWRPIRRGSSSAACSAISRRRPTSGSTGSIRKRNSKRSRFLPARIIEGEKTIEKGRDPHPGASRQGHEGKVGDTVVIVATNKDGSVNGKQFKVGGVLESATGPGGRDGYIHIEDAAEILRMEEQGDQRDRHPAEGFRTTYIRLRQ